MAVELELPIDQVIGQRGVDFQLHQSACSTSDAGAAPGMTALQQVDITISFLVGPGTQTRARFKKLAEEWRRDTALVSSMTKTVMHPAYQQIIGMGALALPLILEDLRENGGHWFWALRAITQQNPADGEITFEGARAVWLRWGRTRGHCR